MQSVKTPSRAAAQRRASGVKTASKAKPAVRPDDVEGLRDAVLGLLEVLVQFSNDPLVADRAGHLLRQFCSLGESLPAAEVRYVLDKALTTLRLR